MKKESAEEEFEFRIQRCFVAFHCGIRWLALWVAPLVVVGCYLVELTDELIESTRNEHEFGVNRNFQCRLDRSVCLPISIRFSAWRFPLLDMDH